MFKSFFSRCGLLLSLCLLSATLAAAPAPAPTRQDVNHYLLLSTEPMSVRLALRGLQLDRSVDTRTLDIVAQYLIEAMPADTDDDGSLDAARLAAKLLGASHNPRYKAALEIAHKKFGQQVALAADIESALAGLGAAANDSYRAGSLTVAGERNRITALFKGLAQASDRTRKLPVAGLTTLQQVLDSAGAPDYMGEFVHVRRHNLAPNGSFAAVLKGVRVANLELMYFGRGSIVLHYDSDWTPVDMVPEIAHPPIHYDGDNAEYAYKLMSSDRFVMNRLVKKLYAQKKRYDPDLLDVMADRLWLGLYAHDKFEVEGLSILCWILGNSGNARYRQVLGDAVSSATRSSLSRHAQKALDKLPAASAEVEVYQRRTLPPTP